MARHVPVKFQDKLHLVQRAVDVARGQERRHFDFSDEVAPGVSLVLSEAGGVSIALSLWSSPTDIAELCGDAAYPATSALLAIDREQAHELADAGVLVDLAQMTRSESTPGLYYALFDHASSRQLHDVLHRLIPALPSHGRAA
ncbi:MAG: hypothetical protein V2J16_01805 [Thermoleophilia bacterium]|jgi:hypothetical protein|nr:hypothetical protein [Thermoleophilia bacterium]